jgi:FKBP-type peptidyl-prolyl cis-trans isomerase FklB
MAFAGARAGLDAEFRRAAPSPCLRFAHLSWSMGQYKHMQKSLTTVFQLLAAGMMLLGNARAQQTPAATTSQSSQPASASSQAAAPAKTSSATAAKKTTTAAKPVTAFTLKTQKDKASYAVGANYGKMLHDRAVPVDAAVVARGLRDAMAGGKLLLTDDQMKAVLTQLQTEVRSNQEAKAREASGPARKAGEAFLAENKSKEGIVTLPSGLQYKILTVGTGPKPTANDTVTCNYRGTLLSGKEFDGSEKHGGPQSFPVGGVIKGWTEALQLMPVGSKWQLFIPPDLAYGDRGAGGDIGPGETLIFEIELISIGDQKK